MVRSSCSSPCVCLSPIAAYSLGRCGNVIWPLAPDHRVPLALAPPAIAAAMGWLSL